MPKNPTIAANNVFCIARKQAASFNDNLNSREGASEELGIDRTRLARIELGSLNPYPEEVLMMSDVYNAPELNNHYCSRLCPLGIKTIAPAELLRLDRLTIKILSALNDADYIPESRAYKIMRELNKELEQQGKITTAGRVSQRYLFERVYC